MSRPKNGSTPKNLTFRPVVIQKAKEIQAETGEELAVLCARLINEEYDRRVDREALLVELLAELFGRKPDEIRTMIDERMAQAKAELESAKGRAKE